MTNRELKHLVTKWKEEERKENIYERSRGKNYEEKSQKNDFDEQDRDFKEISNSVQNSINYLIDTNIFFEIVIEKWDILRNLKNHANGKNMNFILMERIEDQCDTVMRTKKSEGNEFMYKINIEEKIKDTKEKIEKLGTLRRALEEKDQEKMKKITSWAIKFGKKQKYVFDDHKLEEADCILLNIYLSNAENDFVLVTNDSLLKYAASMEGEKYNERKEMIFDSISNQVYDRNKCKFYNKSKIVQKGIKN